MVTGKSEYVVSEKYRYIQITKGKNQLKFINKEEHMHLVIISLV